MIGHLKLQKQLTKSKLDIHPQFILLKAKFDKRMIEGANAKCIAFARALQYFFSSYKPVNEG